MISLSAIYISSIIIWLALNLLILDHMNQQGRIHNRHKIYGITISPMYGILLGTIIAPAALLFFILSTINVWLGRRKNKNA